MPEDDRTGRVEPKLTVPHGERRPARAPTAEEEVLGRLDRFIDGLGGNFSGLTRDLRDSGFGPYALGTAKTMFDHFVSAVEATRRTASAVYPWEEMRSLAARLALEGEETAAAEILEGLAKRSARHALPSDFKSRLEADRRALQERIGEREKSAGPILMPEFSAGPRHVMSPEHSVGGRRLGLAAAGFAAAVMLAVGGNYALMNLGPGAAPQDAAVVASAANDKKPAATVADPAPANREPVRTIDTAGQARGTGAPPVQFDAAGAAPAPDATQRSAAVATTVSQPTERPPVAAGASATATVDATRTGTTPPIDALELNAASRVQKRLSELGYLNGTVDGVWGPRSRLALRDFKSVNGLPNDETLDARTRSVLFSVNARSMEQRGPVGATAGTVVDATPPQSGGEVVAGRTDYQDPPAIVADGNASQPRNSDEPDWDSGSQQAFNEFNALSNSDRYAGGERLRNVGVGGGEGSIVGTWGRGAASCTVGEEQGRDMLWISRQTFSGAGRACEVVEVRRSGANWLVVGRCANGPAAYRFAVNGDRMIEFGSGGTVYRRCEVRRPGMSAAYYDPPTPPEEVGSRRYGPREYYGPRDFETREVSPPREVGGGGVSVGGSSVIVLPRR